MTARKVSRILRPRTSYFGAERVCQLVTLYPLITAGRNELISAGIIKFRVATLSRDATGSHRGKNILTITPLISRTNTELGFSFIPREACSERNILLENVRQALYFELG